MENVEEIKRRMNKEKKVKEHRIMKFFNVIFILMIITLGGLIYCKSDEDGKLIKQIFNQDVSFKELNQTIDNYLNKIFFFKEDNHQSTMNVSGINLYQSLGNNMYITSDKTIPTINNGTIKACSYQDDYKYFVVVEYENNVTALYTLIDDIKVKTDDVLLANNVIGIYEGSYFQCIFKKNNEIISYNEALK